MKNKDVIEAFVNGSTNRNLHTKNVFFDKDVLFSYGYHFPLCIRFKDGFLINKSKYSNTTSRHSGILKRLLANSVVRELSTQELNEIIREQNNFAFLDKTIKDLTRLRMLKNLD